MNILKWIKQKADEILADKVWVEVATIFEPAWYDAFGQVPTRKQLQAERRYVLAQKEKRGWVVKEESCPYDSTQTCVKIAEETVQDYLKYLNGLIDTAGGSPSPMSIIRKRIDSSGEGEIHGDQREERQRRILELLELMIKYSESPEAKQYSAFKNANLLEVVELMVDKQMMKEKMKHEDRRRREFHASRVEKPKYEEAVDDDDI